MNLKKPPEIRAISLVVQSDKLIELLRLPVIGLSR